MAETTRQDILKHDTKSQLFSLLEVEGNDLLIISHAINVHSIEWIFNNYNELKLTEKCNDKIAALNLLIQEMGK